MGPLNQRLPILNVFTTKEFEMFFNWQPLLLPVMTDFTV